MALTAALKFTQGVNTNTPGKSFKATVAGGAVTIANNDNTGVDAWTYVLLDSPRGSALVPGTLSTGASPTTSITPDVSGAYRIQLTVTDVLGQAAAEIRHIVVANSRGWYLPSYLGAGDEFDFPDPTTPNGRGWAAMLDVIFDDIENALNGVTAGSLPEGWLSVKAFGAVGDGVTDDTNAIKTAFLASKNTNKGTVFFPAGEYYMTDHLNIDYPVCVQGVGRGWFKDNQQSTIRFAPYKGIRTRSVLNSASSSSSEYCIIKQMSFYGGHSEGTAGLAPDLHAVWQTSHAYVVGDKVVPTNNYVGGASYNPRQGNHFGFVYECIKAGTTSGTEPEYEDPTKGFFPDYTEAWQANHNYFYSNTVRSPTRFDMIFKCIVPAIYELTPQVSGGTIPAAFATAAIGDVITDGGVSWLACDPKGIFVTSGTAVFARRACAGVTMMTTTILRDCMFAYFINAGIHIQAASAFNNGFPQNIDPNLPEPMAIANCCIISNVRVLHCGMGFYANSADANACVITMSSFLGRMTAPRDTREMGICDLSFLGNYFSGNHISGMGGPAYRIRGGVNASAVEMAYVEGDCNPNEIHAASASFGFGGIKNGFSSDSFFHGVATPGDWRGVQGTSTTTGGVVINSFLKGDRDSVFAWDTPDAGGGHKIAYIDSWMGRGYWSVVSSNSRAAMGWSNQRATEGFGHVRFPHGFVEGGQSDKRFYFASDSDQTDGGARFGARVPGDHTRGNAYATRGGYAERVCTVAGFSSGDFWRATYPVTSGNPSGPFAGQSSIIRPTVANGLTYMCTKSGTTSGVQPTWPTTIAAKVARTWVATGDYWALNSYARPTTPNGKIYQATAISGGRPESYSTTEPTWPTTVGLTVVDASGITWTCDSVDVVASWVADGSAIWTCVGPEAKFENTSFIVAGASLTTTNNTPTVLDSYPAMANNTTKYYKIRVKAEDAANQEAIIFEVEACWIRAAGAETEVTPPSSTLIASNATSPFDACTAVLSVSSHVPTLTVTGATGRTLVWTSELVEVI